MSDELTPERIKEIEVRWKSDVDSKLDRVIRFIDANEALMKMLTEREIDRRALRRAVIEKTLAGLIWGGIVGLGALAWAGLESEASDFMGFLKGASK